MSIEKRGEGYRVRWRDTQGRQRTRQVKRHRDAIKLDGELKRKKSLGELADFDRGTETLAEFGELWWRRYAVPNLSAKTRDNYARLYDKHVLPSLGDHALRSIRPSDVEALKEQLVSKGLAGATARKCLAVLQSIMQRAVVWDYISSNPVAPIKKPRAAPSRGRALTAEQVEAVAAELDVRGAAVVRVLAYTGLRPGELRALCWGDVGASVIRVDRATSAGVMGLPKTNHCRTVTLSAAADRALKEWRLASEYGFYNFVFPAVRGPATALWTDSAWNIWAKRVFSPAAARAGLRGTRPYDLRHTFVTSLIAQGVDPIQVARQAGHSPTMALSTYAHEFESVSAECPSELLDNAKPQSRRPDSNRGPLHYEGTGPVLPTRL